MVAGRSASGASRQRRRRQRLNGDVRTPAGNLDVVHPGQRRAADRARSRPGRSPRFRRAGAAAPVRGAGDLAQTDRRQHRAGRRSGSGDVLARVPQSDVVSPGSASSRPGCIGSPTTSFSPTRERSRSCRCPRMPTASAIADADGAPAPSMSRQAALSIDLERAMRVLSEAERAAIVQCYHNDLSHEEAAQVLGCPVGTVKTHILRAKQKLKARLGGHGARKHEHADDMRHAPTGSTPRSKQAGREHRAAYVADDGFTARVMARLPPPPTLPAWRRPVIVLLWAAGGRRCRDGRCRARSTMRSAGRCAAPRTSDRTGRLRGRCSIAVRRRGMDVAGLRALARTSDTGLHARSRASQRKRPPAGGRFVSTAPARQLVYCSTKLTSTLADVLSPSGVNFHCESAR